MRFITVSDTHNHPIPRFNGDVMIHAGDMTGRGTEGELIKAADEIAGYPCKKLIVIPGNHDLLFEKNERIAREIFADRRITVLIDELYEYKGVKIYGSPRQPEFCNWAFGYPRLCGNVWWDRIPNNIDVLVTHGPPKWTLDQEPDGEHLGCEDLAQAVLRVKPKYHVFGHIHAANGFAHNEDTTFINAAICSEMYQPFNPPIAFNYGPISGYETMGWVK